MRGTPDEAGEHDPVLESALEGWSVQHEAQHDVAARGRAVGPGDVNRYLASVQYRQSHQQDPTRAVPAARKAAAGTQPGRTAAPRTRPPVTPTAGQDAPPPAPPVPPMPEDTANAVTRWWRHLVHRSP